MLPNTIPLYSAPPVAPAIDHGLEGTAFRVSDDNQRGEFRCVLDGGKRMDFTVQHSVQNGKAPAVSVDRHTVRISKTKVDETTGAEDVASVSMTLAAPRRNFTRAEMIGLTNALWTIVLNPGATQDDLQLGTETYANMIIDQLLSGVI